MMGKIEAAPRHTTELAIRALIAAHPGIRARDIALRVGVTKGRVSQVIQKLKDGDYVEQVRDGAGRGLALRLLRTRRLDWVARVAWRKNAGN